MMKYNAKKVKDGNIIFDSRKEKKRWEYLRDLQDAGEITDLRRQVPFMLIPPIVEEVIVQLKTKTKTKMRTVQRAITYIADFTYTLPNGESIVEDVKGSPRILDPKFVLKAKLFRWRYGYPIRQVYDPVSAIPRCAKE